MDQRQGLTTWVVVSAGLMIIGAFGPWVTALGTSVNGTDGSSSDGWLVVGAAAVGWALFMLTRKAKVAGLWATLAGAVSAFITIHDRHHADVILAHSGSLVRALVHVGWGLNLAMIASISLALAGIVWMAQIKPSAANTELGPTG